MSSSISMIWAQDRHGIIGNGTEMPWHLPEDLQHFSRTTGTDVVIMGRKTWHTIPEKFRPLPRRTNIVCSTNTAWDCPGAHVAHSPSHAVDLAGDRPVWIMGGKQIYDLFLPLSTQLVVTEVDYDARQWADQRAVTAPNIDETWTQQDCSPWLASESGHPLEDSSVSLSYRIVRYRRTAT